LPRIAAPGHQAVLSHRRLPILFFPGALRIRERMRAARGEEWGTIRSNTRAAAGAGEDRFGSIRDVKTEETNPNLTCRSVKDEETNPNLTCRGIKDEETNPTCGGATSKAMKRTQMHFLLTRYAIIL
jgi:hypothetical protein